jgi:hypothetical protein
MVTSCWLNPTELTTNDLAVVGAVNENAPAASVVVPPFEPLTVTDAPCTGAPLASVIFPVITFVWEKANCVKDTHNKRIVILLSNRFMVIINGLSN